MKKKIILIVIICVIVIGIVLLLINKNKGKNNGPIIENNNTNYDRIKDIVNNGKEAIIYYYNSDSTAQINSEIKTYLDKEKINYYIYDAAKINQEEYNNILKALNIDNEIFGLPAIIYIFSGKVYSDIININDIEIVKRYVEENELTNVKVNSEENQT